MISFRIEGQPLPKGRPRFSKGKVYTPQETKDFETLVRQVAGIAIRGGGYFEDEPLHVKLEFYRKGDKKADIDNLTKAIFDALNGTAWGDDKQVRRLEVALYYGQSQPCTLISICHLATEPKPKISIFTRADTAS